MLLVANLPNDIEELKQITLEKEHLLLTTQESLSTTQKELGKAKDRSFFLEEEVRRLRQELFGKKSEKRKPVEDKQGYLFDEAEEGVRKVILTQIKPFTPLERCEAP